MHCQRWFSIFIIALMAMFMPKAEACDICAIHPFSDDTGSVTTGAGTTLSRGSVTSGFVFEHRKWDELGHRNAHELHEDGRDIHNFDHDEFYHFVFGYGVTDDFEIGLSFPIVQKTFLRVEDGVIGRGDESIGAGDLTLTSKYQIFHDQVAVATIGSIKFPTGDTAQTGFDGKKLEPEEVPGTGSFDYMLGLAASKSYGNFTLGGDLLYTFKTEGAQEREFGDVLRFDILSSYALREPGTYPNVQLMGEFNAQFMDRDRGRSGKIFDSGGRVFFVTPGVSLALSDEMSLFFSVPVPVYQDRGGQHPEVKYSILTGMNITWI
jgi:hypothetical protein